MYTMEAYAAKDSVWDRRLKLQIDVGYAGS